MKILVVVQFKLSVLKKILNIFCRILINLLVILC